MIQHDPLWHLIYSRLIQAEAIVEEKNPGKGREVGEKSEVVEEVDRLKPQPRYVLKNKPK